MAIKKRGTKKVTFHHYQAVPKRFRHLEKSAMVWASLKTDSEAIALAKAAQIEAMNLARWEMIEAGQTENAAAQYDAIRKLAASRGFAYLPAADIAAGRLRDLADRIKEIERAGGDTVVRDALLGAVPVPRLRMSGLVDRFADLTKDRRANKSPDQLRRWRHARDRAVANFVAAVGDIEVAEITRADALKFRDWWWQRVEREGVQASTANKDIVALAAMIAAVCKFEGRDNPKRFSGLMFAEDKGQRPPFSRDWIAGRLLAAGALAGLNAQARDVLIALINTGARPSELIELRAAQIRLDTNLPHILIEPAAGHDLKTKQSRREIPLVGVSLDAMRRNRDGFARYRGKPSNWSALVTKYLRKHGLLESARHTAYSLRHTFSDSLVNAGIDSRIRKELMGHKVEGQIYGDGASLPVKFEAIGKIAF